MQKLTVREKTLLYIAALLLLISAGYHWLKQPSDMARLGAETELSVLKLEAQQRRLIVQQLPELEQELKQERQTAEAENGHYPLYSSNSILISDIIENLIPHGLIMESVQVTGESLDQGEPLSEKSTTEHRVTEQEGVVQQPEEASGYVIHQKEITVSARGMREDFYSFLDWAKEEPWLAVTSYTITSLENQTGTEWDLFLQEEVRILMTVSYSMLELTG